MAAKTGLTLRLDSNSRQPAYLQIVRQLAGQAVAHKLHPGQRLPPVRTLARQLGLNFNTVARAYRILQRRGLLSAQRGRGTYVSPRISWSAATHRRILAELACQYVEDARLYRFTGPEIRAALGRCLDATGRLK